MDLKNISKETAKTIVSYLTYQAVRVVIGQLRETNPPLCTWLHRFSSTGTIQDGEVFLTELLRANQDLAFRVMTVRAHLAEEVMDFMPEMVQTTIQQANMAHRKRYLERITQLDASELVPSAEAIAELDNTSESTDSSSSSSRSTGNADPDSDTPLESDRP